MRTLISTNGYTVKIDDADYEWAAQFNWIVREGKRGVLYVYRAAHENGRQRNLYLHRELLGRTRNDGILVDHRDRNGLNNQRHNLRSCSRPQNQANSVKPQQAKATSTLKGVSLHKPTGLWRARIKVNYKARTLGYFKTEEAAHEAYKHAAQLEFGEFARSA